MRLKKINLNPESTKIVQLLNEYKQVGGSIDELEEVLTYCNGSLQDLTTREDFMNIVLALKNINNERFFEDRLS